MSIKETVIDILCSPAAQGIRFSFNSVTQTPVEVSGVSFRRVARAIEHRKIKVIDDLRLLQPGSDGEYWGENVFIVPPTRHRRYQEAVVVHEAVHASFDLTHSHVPAIDNEVAAYIAGTIYLRRTGFPRGGYNATLEEYALPIANSVLRSAPIEDRDLEKLRHVLLHDKLYYDLLTNRKEGHGAAPIYLLDVGDG